MGITGDDEIGSNGKCARKYSVIIRIYSDARDFGGKDLFDEIFVEREHLGGRASLVGQPARNVGSVKHFGELSDKLGGAEEIDFPVGGEFDHLTRWTLPSTAPMTTLVSSTSRIALCTPGAYRSNLSLNLVFSHRRDVRGLHLLANIQ